MTSTRASTSMAAISPIFRTRYTVQPEDIDELGHVSNIAYVRWMQEVARGHSTDVGWTPETYAAAGCIFVVRRHEIDYLASAMLGEEVEVITWLSSWQAATSVRQTRIIRTRDAKEILRAATTWVLVNTNGRPVRIPPPIVNAFTAGAPPAGAVAV